MPSHPETQIASNATSSHAIHEQSEKDVIPKEALDQPLVDLAIKKTKEHSSTQANTAAEKTQPLLHYHNLIHNSDLSISTGKVLQVTGLTIMSEGPGDASIGDIVQIEINPKNSAAKQKRLHCEVLGFQDYKLILMPLGSIQGIAPEAKVYLSQKKKLSMPACPELQGRILNALGEPIDGKGVIYADKQMYLEHKRLSPLERENIREQVHTGVRSIDALLSVGRGQRIGIFAGTGVGKSTLLGMIARYTHADINVICLVGERGREVKEFIENELGKEALKHSVVFVATSDSSAMEKSYAAGFANSTAEYFRDQGYHVNLYVDSITRYVLALREIAINSGEQLGPGGFPPRVWQQLSYLLERAGNTSKGSVTGFYTILVEADDLNEPVTDNTRGILDGHILLTRERAQKNLYPAIDITQSISRIMDKVVSSEHKLQARWLKKILAAYQSNEELIRVGAYVSGSDSDVDFFLRKKQEVESFLCQEVEEESSLEHSLAMLQSLYGDQDSLQSLAEVNYY